MNPFKRRRWINIYWPAWRERWCLDMDGNWVPPRKRYCAGWHPMWAYWMRRGCPSGPPKLLNILRERLAHPTCEAVKEREA